MAYDNTITVAGNATRDPELRFSAGGTAVVGLSIAWNKKTKDGPDEVSFFDVTCFGQLAENVADTVTRGTRIVVTGHLRQRSWEKDGQKRSKVEIVADDVAPSLKWAAAKIERNSRDDKPATRGAVASSYDPDEEPF